MGRPAIRRSYIPWSLLVGVVLGFGTNLVTANPAQWWGPLQPVSQYAPVWFPASVVAVLGWGVFRSWHALRRVRWRRSDSPYAGLAAFTSDRASVFFGRDEETRGLVDRLSRSGADPRLRIIPLVGPSGCGKSSLINAGVVPRLSSRWQVLGPIRPGASPFTALAAALTATAAGAEVSAPARMVEIQECAQLLRDDADQLATGDMNTRAGGQPAGLLAQLIAAQSDSRHLLLIIDQWEELVTQAPAPERSRFMTLLYGGLAAQRSLHVLAAMRPEFWQDFLTCAPDHRVGPACPLGPLEPRLVRQAIVRPAEAAGIEFEPGLVDDMVTEATGGDALPLLGHLLQRLSDDAGDDRRITRDAYERAGRVVGAVAEHAEEVYVRLVDIEGTEGVDQTLLLFVSWEGREPARHAIAVADLDDAGQRVAREFQDARLIVEDSDGAVLDLAHEALIRRWDRLRNLATANRERLRQRTAVDRRAQAWWASGCPDDEVLRGRALEDAEQLFTNSGVSHTTRQFITASRAHQRADLDRRADQAAERAQHLRHHDSGLAIALAQVAVHELAPSRKAVLTLWGLVSAPKVVRLPLGHSEPFRVTVGDAA
jgi:hypothetical protein